MNGGPELLNAYLNGQDLSPQEAQDLSAWVCADVRHAEWAAELTHLDAQMAEIIRTHALGGVVGDDTQVPTAEQIFAEVIAQERASNREAQAARRPDPVAGPGPALTARAAEPVAPRRVVVVIPRWVAVAAMVLVVVWGGYLTTRPQADPAAQASAPAEEQTPTPPALARPPEVAIPEPVQRLPWSVLRDSVGARWAGPAPLAKGQAVGDAPLELLSGLARFEMANGTTVLVEGPARLRMEGPDRLRLTRGRLTADVPLEGQGFTVAAPNAQIVDYGTSFGVEVDPHTGSIAQVFDGEVRVTPTANGIATADPQPLYANQAGSVPPTGQGISLLAPNDTRFVRQATYQALSGELGDEAYSRAVRTMWARDSELLAAHGFETSDVRDAHGMKVSINTGRWALLGESLALAEDANPTGTALPGRLMLDAFEVSSLYFDLDLSDDGSAARAGLIREDSATLGRDGTRVCLSWRMMLESGEIGLSDAWAGVSLFDVRADGAVDEYLFVGRPSRTPGWGLSRHRRGPDVPVGSGAVAQLLPPPTRTEVRPGGVVRWLVVIDFRAGPDQISFYLNPDPDDLGEATLILDDMDLRFNRLRFEAANDRSEARWSLDEMRIGTTIQSVLNN